MDIHAEQDTRRLQGASRQLDEGFHPNEFWKSLLDSELWTMDSRLEWPYLYGGGGRWCVCET